jgi:GTP-binding protein HflX
VVDLTSPHMEKHHATTLTVLGELGVDRKTIVTVFNKVDGATEEMRARAHHLAADGLFVSALTGEGLPALEQRFAELIADAFRPTELLIPHSRYDVVAKLHSLGHIQSEEQRDDGVLIHGRFPASQKAIFAPFVVPSPAVRGGG